MEFEAVIIGGGTAGLSAAMALGRMNRQTLMLDTGLPRNRFSSHAQNVFTRDGMSPAELLRIARAQVKAYPSVFFEKGAVAGAEMESGGFKLTTAEGSGYRANRLILAAGVTDILPGIPGLAPLWGSKVIHCPFCHGWEAREGHVGMIIQGATIETMTPLVHGLNKNITILSNGPANVSPSIGDWLRKEDIRLVDWEIFGVEDVESGVELVFDGGRRLLFDAVYLRPNVQYNNEVAVQLGCTLGPEGAVAVNLNYETSVEGVFAVGDLASPNMHQVIVAAASGTRAGITCARSLLMEGLGA